MKRIFFAILLCTTLFSACKEGEKQTFQTGFWKGELAVQDKWAPFIFEVKSDNDLVTVTLRNGDERVNLEGVYLIEDTVVIPITTYDAYIKATLTNDELDGLFLKNYIENDTGVPFRAVYNQSERFSSVQTPAEISIDGRWNINFINDENDTTKNIGVFKTDGEIITGSVLTNHGDLRFLEGKKRDNGVVLSAFSGLSPYLFEINFIDDDHFEGKFYNVRGITKLEGKRNSEAALADPYSLTKLKSGFESLSFSLPNIKGEKISINDDKYKDKVIIISILGSWCPNCLDEMEFLSPWYDENRNRGVEIIGLAFERKDDFEYGKGTLSKLIDRYETNYEILFAGQVGSKSIEKALPEVEKISSYPTTFFIDKKGKVRKIHTGFNGPATGQFYEEFKKEFNLLVNQLLSE